MRRFSEEMEKYKNSPKRKAYNLKKYAKYGPFHIPVKIWLVRMSESYTTPEEIKEAVKKYGKEEITKLIENSVADSYMYDYNGLVGLIKISHHQITTLDLDKMELIITLGEDGFVTNPIGMNDETKVRNEADVCDFFDKKLTKLGTIYTHNKLPDDDEDEEEFSITVEIDGHSYPDPNVSIPDAARLEDIRLGVETEHMEFWDDPGAAMWDDYTQATERDEWGNRFNHTKDYDNFEFYRRKHAQKNAMYNPAKDDEDTYSYSLGKALAGRERRNKR